MKIGIKIVLLFLLIIHYSNGYSQDKSVKGDTISLKKELNFEIVFGVYIDDSYNHKFEAKERKWILQNGNLSYKIDTNYLTYADTLTLKEADIKTIIVFIEEHNLLLNINKDLTKDYSNQYEYTSNIIGQLSYNNQTANYQIRTNTPGSFDDDSDASELKKLEDLLYQIIETYKE